MSRLEGQSGSPREIQAEVTPPNDAGASPFRPMALSRLKFTKDVLEASTSVGTLDTVGGHRRPVQDEHLLELDEGSSPKRGNGIASTTPRQALHSVLSSWMSRRFLSGCAVLFPLAVTVYVTWWFLTFFDNFFSPVYKAMFGFKVFGLGFVTSMAFIFGTGVFVSSWLGGLLLQVGEWIIRKLPLVKHIYSAAKQVSAAVNPGNESTASFRECVIIRHPRQGELAFGFITGQTILSAVTPAINVSAGACMSPDQPIAQEQLAGCVFDSVEAFVANLRKKVVQDEKGDRVLFSVYVPTNHIYVGDIFLLEKHDIIRPNLSVREGLEIVVSVGMALPKQMSSLG